jgi:hypothetical protein
LILPHHAAVLDTIGTQIFPEILLVHGNRYVAALDLISAQIFPEILLVTGKHLGVINTTASARSNAD